MLKTSAFYIPVPIAKALAALGMKPQEFLRALLNEAVKSYPNLAEILLKATPCSLMAVECEIESREVEKCLRMRWREGRIAVNKATKRKASLGTTSVTMSWPTDAQEEKKD